MASLRRHPQSPFWIACFTDSDGTRTSKTTGLLATRENKREAQRVALGYEDMAMEGAKGRLMESKVRKVLADIFSKANQQELPSSTAEDFFASWIKRKEIETGSPKTVLKYRQVAKDFVAHLGPRAKRDISTITSADITAFRDAQAQRAATGTANLALKIVRSAFQKAHRDGLVDVNEAARVTVIKQKGDKFKRRAFTMEELKRVLAVADDEWRGMLLCGLYTGQRLGDIAALTWNNVDLQTRQLVLTTQKTDRTQILPIAGPLLRHLESLPAGDVPGAPLFPRCHAVFERQGQVSNLSNAFRELLVAAGLAKPRTHKADPTKQGRSVKRELDSLSFHSLRHTATTWLKSAGVSDAVAREFIGHDSATVSQSYTHIETATLEAAANKLPDVLK